MCPHPRVQPRASSRNPRTSSRWRRWAVRRAVSLRDRRRPIPSRCGQTAVENPVDSKFHRMVVLVYSRYSFFWPLVQQTVEATIEGLEQAWRFFGGHPVRLIMDNFPAAVAGPDALNPRPTRAFREYSLARGLI